MKKTIRIEGMACMHCVGAVTQALEALAGMEQVKVDLDEKMAVVEYAGGSITDQAIQEAVEEEGFTVIEILQG